MRKGFFGPAKSSTKSSRAAPLVESAASNATADVRGTTPITATPPDIADRTVKLVDQGDEEETRSIGELFYQDAPDELLRLMLSMLPDETVGRFNNVRLASRRLMHIVESICRKVNNGTIWPVDHNRYFPPMLQKFERIEHLVSYDFRLGGLQGCPVTLKTLFIDGQRVGTLEPLSLCIGLEELTIKSSSVMVACPVTDLSPLTACLKLRKVNIIHSRVQKLCALPSIKFLGLGHHCPLPFLKDITPLENYPLLTFLNLKCNKGIVDLSPLTKCKLISVLVLDQCSQVGSLMPLASLPNLTVLSCFEIDPLVSFAPLAIQSLRVVCCTPSSVGVFELLNAAPWIYINSDPNVDLHKLVAKTQLIPGQNVHVSNLKNDKGHRLPPARNPGDPILKIQGILPSGDLLLIGACGATMTESVYSCYPCFFDMTVDA